MSDKKEENRPVLKLKVKINRPNVDIKLENIQSHIKVQDSSTARSIRG